MNRKRLVSGMACLGLLAGYIYSTPYITLFMLKRAIEARSAKDVEKFIDFGDVRDSLRSQLASYLQEEAAEQKVSPELMQFSTGVATALGGTVIDIFVQPGNLQKWLDGVGMPGVQNNEGLPSLTNLAQSIDSLRLGYVGFDEFEIEVKDSMVVNGFILERRNIFRWKIVGVKLNKTNLGAKTTGSSIPSIDSNREQSSLEFWSQVPSGCEHIQRRSTNNQAAFYFVAPCNRGGVVEEYSLSNVILESSSVLHVPSQTVGNYGLIGGYFCSKDSIPASLQRANCVAAGWVPG